MSSGAERHFREMKRFFPLLVIDYSIRLLVVVVVPLTRRIQSSRPLRRSLLWWLLAASPSPESMQGRAHRHVRLRQCLQWLRPPRRKRRQQAAGLRLQSHHRQQAAGRDVGRALESAPAHVSHGVKRVDVAVQALPALLWERRVALLRLAA